MRRAVGRLVGELRRALRLDHGRAQVPHLRAFAVDGAVCKHPIGVNCVLALKVDGAPARMQEHDALVASEPCLIALGCGEPAMRALDVGMIRAKLVRPPALVRHNGAGVDERVEARRSDLGNRLRVADVAATVRIPGERPDVLDKLRELVQLKLCVAARIVPLQDRTRLVGCRLYPKPLQRR
eukprot:2449720-Prymnesium_polylepis.1